MDGTTKELRQRWKERTEAAFERMFAGKSEEELRTLSQRETMAELIGRELSTFLLEEHVATDATARPPGGLAACCPKCHQAGKRAVEQEKLPSRSMTTRVGDIHIQRQRWRCEKWIAAEHAAGIPAGVPAAASRRSPGGPAAADATFPLG